jgi:catechol 2,3-dioxygenase-like lactoylglutathione lyase family enzyme
MVSNVPRMGISVAFAGIAVADYETARAWYERLLGREPDMVPTEGEAAWQLAEAGWLYVVADAERAGSSLLTLLVDDLDEHLAQLAGRRLFPDGSQMIPGVVRKATFTDPDGNLVTFGQSLGGDGS